MSEGSECVGSECPLASLPSAADTLHDMVAGDSTPDLAWEFGTDESHGLVTEDHPSEAELASAVAETSSAAAEKSSAAAEKSSPDTDFSGTIGILCGNWGGNKAECDLQAHMQFDLKSGPCTCILLQEATEEVLANLRAPGEPGILEEGLTRGGGGKHWSKRQSFQYLGLRGKNRHDVMIACRVSHCESMQMLSYRARQDGTFMSGKKTKRKRTAMTTWMVAACRMRHFSLPAVAGGSGAGADPESQRSLAMMSIHLHHATAKKEVSKGGTSLARLWDEVVQTIVKFGARVLAGDFNMALWLVAVELRGRGLDVNLAAWYPWKPTGLPAPRIDSCAIFLVGPSAGIRTIFDASSIVPSAVAEDDRPKAWQKVEEVVFDEAGKVLGRRPFPLTICARGAGEPLANYRPKGPRIEEFVQWSCGASLEKRSPAVVGPRDLARKQQDTSTTRAVDIDMGEPSWEWADLPPCIQKLVEMQKFDPTSSLWPRGAHMPIMVYMGGPSRRSADARARRAKRADERGWNYERRHQGQTSTHGRGSSGASVKGRGAGKGGGGQPAPSSGSQGAGAGRDAAAQGGYGGGNTRDGGGWKGWSRQSWNTSGGESWNQR